MTYAPDFDMECRLCGATPCVIVVGHLQPDSELCGWHFFGSPEYSQWELWEDFNNLGD